MRSMREVSHEGAPRVRPLHLEPGPFSEHSAQLHRDDVVLERLDSHGVPFAQASLLLCHARAAFMGSSSSARPAADLAQGLLPGGACLGRAGGPAGTLQALC